ncbi:hypothetical protein ACFPL7_24225 [Dongia soli]|uniref:Uncharacterized protein n=1 Tax=Dongia soli TaxID=600628 RepID=A0ABU5EHB6_9PROT|nr:hypothetical protein [Dongia soli]MDY0885409.1 hypothetical protein [Dongia soli]
MRYTEAFAKLGYKVELPRQDYTAASERGVCITVWRCELKTRKGLPSLDSREDAGPIEEWGQLHGSRKRVDHFALAIQKFGGVVDVVIVEGVPGEGVKDAHPWMPAERKGSRWHVTYLDPLSGHFAVEARLGQVVGQLT